jgi:glycyl-tRNA synthetase
MLEERLPIPAYDHLLKLSHVFNVLDARGAVGVTERQACFATLRALARQITGSFIRAKPASGNVLPWLSTPAQAC